MRLAIIGLPQSGKTTLFNALTRGDRPITVSGGRFDVNTAVVDVPDSRVDRLVEMFHPRKIGHAKVTYADVAGLEGKAGSNGGLPGPLVNQLSQMDGFVHVVRCFPDENIPHPLGNVDPARDIAVMESEFILNDLIIVERRLERLNEERRRGIGRDKAAIERELALLERLKIALESEQPLRELELSTEEQKIISGFGFLSRKPILILYNLGESQNAPGKNGFGPNCAAAAIQGQLEMEIAQLPPEDAREFMAEYGIANLALERVIAISYDLLGLQSFFTVGEDEVRAWTVRQGATALEAAGTIHSDLQKGFIRAEVVNYKDLLDLGGLSEARSRGKLRLEGKEYPVQDGEIVHVRFNI